MKPVRAFEFWSTTALVAALGLAAFPLAQAQTASGPMASGSAKPMASTAPMSGQGSEELNKSMMSGMKSMQDMKPSGDTDKDFAMMMRMHHQQALDMAQIEIERGKSPAMKAMARKIIAAQKKEIGEFDQWIRKHP